jgi:hypothetical protein
MAPIDVAAAAIEAYNRHDLAAFAGLHAPDARIEFAGVEQDIGLDAWIPVLGDLFAAVPDLTIEPVTVLGDEATAIIEMRQVGTNTGAIALTEPARAFLGVVVDELPPTGRSIDVAGVVVLNTDGGLVTRERHHWPPQWFDQQLGLVTLEVNPTVVAP